MKTVFKAGLAAAALLVAGAMPASAQSRVQVGTLSCNLAPNVSFVLGSVREMSCSFLPSSRSAKAGTYQGVTRRFGIDLGFSTSGRMVWAVFAPTAVVGRGALRGTYVGASTNASFGVGLGANVLVGGSSNTIALQPLSVEGQTGVNLALGVSDLTLR
ncbi:DUF992 domain-containing protein [Xanthobacter oligotrophicus]|uniref:DUF992 domain-containing protein n=1 Tax=Xanthobacter oligotrophicus TaxID=2607286 RepID=UPI0011F2CE01|nr:DUF992 domain-containing protein [Xanthobacter oligotrophicus]MCG5236834.1 DUF992 domain-containing protein [Xanthobacter oligotrophicus]